MTRKDLQQALGLSDEKHFRTAYMQAALRAGVIERTIPDKPHSRLQRYRLTEEGKEVVASRGEVALALLKQGDGPNVWHCKN